MPSSTAAPVHTRLPLLLATATVVSLAVVPATVAAQHDRHAGHQGGAANASPGRATLPGQDAFGAIAEVVKLLESDPATDWSKVDLEALRQHLIDMNAVTLGAQVAQRNVAGGVELTVTGEGRALQAIRRMVTAHRHVLMQEGLEGAAGEIPGGVRWTVTTPDAARVARLRALGFIGIMTLGDHHTTHHLQLARGEAPERHTHP